MKRLKLITKYFMKSALESNFGNKKMSPVVTVLLSLFVLGCLSAPFTMLVPFSYNALAAIGQEGFLITIILLAGSAVTFVLGIYTILNVFYFSNDIEQILPLPFKSSEIVFGKFLTVLIDMYLYTLIMLFPLIAYGISSKAGITYYIYSILSIIVIPIPPMIIASLICMLLMRFTGLSKHKDAFRMFTGTLMLVLVVAFNFFNQSSNSGNGDEVLVKLASSGNNSLMNSVSSIIITNKLTAYGLLYNRELKGLIYILAAVVIAVALFGIYYVVGGSLYYKGIIGASETYSKRENILESKNTDKLIKSNSPIKALVLKDIKLLFRTPQFFINCIAMLIYIPAIFGIAFFAKGSGSLGEYVKGDQNLYGYAIVAVLAFSIVCISSGGAALTAISREGKDFMVSKYIPVSNKDYIISKIISSLLINEISALIVIGIMIFIRIPSSLVLLGGVISVGAVAVISLLQLYLDCKSPRLEWENEREMFQKNKYLPLVLMLVSLVIGAIFAGLAFIIKNYLIIFFVIAIVLVVAGVILVNMLNKACEESVI